MTVHWTQALATMAVQHLWHGALLLCVALLLGHARLGAETRSWVLCIAFALAALSPLLVFLPGDTSMAPTTMPAAMQQAGMDPGGTQPVSSPALPDTMAVDGSAPGALASALQGVILAWLLGTLWHLVRLLQGWRQARQLHRTAVPAVAFEEALRGELPTGTRIALSDAVAGPMVVGLRRPRILVPPRLADAMAPGALHDLLRHEIAHVHRRDLWVSTVQRAVLALYWWSPFLAQLGKRLDLAREMACDERAARRAGGGSSYARSLLAGAANRVHPAYRIAPLAVGMSGQSGGLAQRVDGLLALDATTERLAVRAGWAGLCVLALMAHVGVTVAATPRLGTAHEAAGETGASTVTTVPARQVQQLIEAAAAGDIATVRRLIEAGVPVDARQRGDGTPLIVAAKQGQQATVDALLKLGAQPDLPSSGDGNPLIAAASRGQHAVVAQLIDAGADVNRIVVGDETPLINAARSGHLDTVALLVEHGADVNLGVVADFGQWRSPLNQARNARVRDYLMQQGAMAGQRTPPSR